MIEMLMAVAVVLVAAAGLGIGLVFGRGPARNGCAAMACRAGTACEGCPRRRTDGRGEAE